MDIKELYYREMDEKMISIQKKEISRKRIALIVSITLFVVVCIGLIFLFSYYINQNIEDSKYETTLNYRELTQEIGDYTNRNISLLSGFSAFIQIQDDFDNENVYSYLDYLLKDHLDEIRNVGVLVDTTIRWTYPLEGNEEAVGVDLSKIPDQADSIMYVKNTLKTQFVGPVDLIQGGIGFIIRIPLLKDDVYWGMVSIVLKAENTFDFIEEFSDAENVEYLITHEEDDGNIIYGDASILDQAPLKFQLDKTIGGWTIYTIPSSGWPKLKNIHLLIFFLMLVVSGLLSRVFFNWIIKYNDVLEDIDELEKKYIRDQFTGIYTREFFNMRIKEAFSEAMRHSEKLSMIYFDLDHFKNVNDTFGHARGDKILLSLVDCVNDIIRKEDIFARWGGDEFILLLPQTGIEGASLLSERIRKNIEQDELIKLHGVTISVGCSEWVYKEYLESWFKRTDKALYVSKNTGKNKVTQSDHTKEKHIIRKIDWNKNWNTGNSQIDSEHKALLMRSNEIISGSLSEEKFEETIRNISIMIQEVKQHFDHEIDILKSVDYRDLIQHELIHQKLLKRLNYIYNKASHQQIDTSELFVFLIDVILEAHFLNEDRKYIPYLKKK